MDMDEKLRLLMQALDMKPAQLARALEINPAILSHILAKRNKPGVDLLQRILEKFPQVSPDWLLLNRGDLLRSGATVAASAAGTTGSAATTSSSTTIAASEQELFTASTRAPHAAAESGPPPTLPAEADGAPSAGLPETAGTSPAQAGKRVVCVVLCYADGTFASYTPENMRK